MLANLNRSDQAEADKGGASLRERFKAWWDGYDLPNSQPVEAPVPTPDPEPKPRHEVRYEVPEQHWETSRLSLVQTLWGEGFTTPGGQDHILTMVKILGLDPAMTVFDLGAGLGGAARTMCQTFGVWVSGFEVDKDLAEAGMALSVKAGMSEKAQISAFDPNKFKHKQKSVDCVFSKEFLYTVEDKEKFLKSIEILLKPKGQLLFTDYTLAKPHHRTPSLEKWAEREPITPRPWALEDYVEALAKLHLDIRVAEDVTQAFRAKIIRGWANFTETTPRGSIGNASAPALVDEVEIWTRRVQAIDDGDLKVCRVHAIKKDTDLMMSDW